jgi:hypothetical protein
MRPLLIASVALMGFITAGESQARSYKFKGHVHAGKHLKRLTQHQLDTLPIRVTRPPNTGHYIHQDFPLWAARAFQPTRSR